MKSKFFYCFILLSIFSCSSLFDNNDDGYRDGSNTGPLVNNGSIVGSWTETYEWKNVTGEGFSAWSPLNIRYSDNYIFLEDGTFTSTKNINGCLGTSGTYKINGSKLTLKYVCEPNVTKDVLIDEFFFREKYIVFIKDTKISKFELAR